MSYEGVGLLKGKTIVEVTGMESGSERVVFRCSDNTSYMMYHEQYCCESVYLEDICGDVSDLIDAVVITAEERCDDGESDWGTYTWTFYDIQTNKGCVNLRWNGESNGYYSESVYFVEIDQR